VTTPREHFDWAVKRAIEYIELGNAGDAMASLVSDLGKHPDTSKIMTRDLQFLLCGEILTGGLAGVRRFIEGLPPPAETTPGAAP
jgi:hypothetical protein